MSKYCNRCKKDLENDNYYSYKKNDNYYSYKKSICKQCVNKKVKCNYCDKEFNSTILSKHTKQIHSTIQRSDKSDSTLQRSDKSDSTSQRSDKSDSTLQRSDKSNEPLYPTIEDSLYLNKHNKLMRDKIYDMKTQDKINIILTKSRKLHDKIKNNTITKREEKQYEKNLNKLKDLDYFDERVCKILLKYKYLD